MEKEWTNERNNNDERSKIMRQVGYEEESKIRVKRIGKLSR